MPQSRIFLCILLMENQLYLFTKSLPALVQRFKEYNDQKYLSVVTAHFTKPLEVIFHVLFQLIFSEICNRL